MHFVQRAELIDHEELADLRERHDLLRVVTRAHELYFRDASLSELFSVLLADLLALTRSEYGYIAEVLYEDERPYLKTWAVTDIAWNDETRRLYDTRMGEGDGLEFRNLETLFGWGLFDGGRLVIANDPARDPRAAGRPRGHAPLDAFLAVPVHREGRLVGQIAVANRPGGYDSGLVERLQPFTVAIGSLIDAYRSNRERREAQRDQRRSEARLAAIVSHLSDIVTIIGVDGRWVWSSPAGSRLLGYPSGFDPDGGVFSLLHPDDVDMAQRALDEIIAGQRRFDEPVDLRVRAADGSFRVIETFGDNLADVPGVNGVLLTSHDVTERRRVEAQLFDRTSELATLLGSMRDAVLCMDDKGRVRVVNQAFSDLFLGARPAESMMGDGIGKLLHEGARLVADSDSFVAQMEGCYRTHRARVGDVWTLLDGRVLESDYTSIECGAEALAAHLWIFRDVTERTNLERERQDVLTREREARANIEAQNRQLRELNELKSAFVGMASHELRTPLTSIVSYSQLLSEDLEGFTAEQRDFVSVIVRNADRLQTLVGDLLLIAKLESRALEVCRLPANFNLLIVTVLRSFEALAAEKSLTVRCTFDPSEELAMLDASRFEQVVVNLLSNAIKFTPAGGSVEVRTKRRESEWLLEVADTGMGIPEAEQSELFKRFYRGSNARLNEVPGTGLGLAIARAIVDAHEGKIEVSSSSAGTTVCVTIPDSVHAH